MSDERLETILESYGAAPHRWPAQDRAAALALLRHSDEARRRWVEAAALDVLMVPEQAPDPSAALMDRLKAIPDTAPVAKRQPETPRPAGRRLFSFRLPAAAAFASVVLAFLVGLAMPAPFGGDATDPVAVTAEVGIDDGGLAEDVDDEILLVDSWPEETGFAEEATDDFELAVLDLALD